MGVPGSNPGKGPLNRLALKATIHCLTGCSIGEVLGLVIATSLGLNSLTAIVLAVALAYLFGYIFTLLPLMRTGMSVPKALKLALASDTVSITAMEIVDNAIMLVIPGAMDAGLTAWRFWGSLALALVVAGVVTYPVVRWLIFHGRGHAVVHDFRSGDHHHPH